MAPPFYRSLGIRLAVPEFLNPAKEAEGYERVLIYCAATVKCFLPLGDSDFDKWSQICHHSVKKDSAPETTEVTERTNSGLSNRTGGMRGYGATTL
jgi:hypothetical protein